MLEFKNYKDLMAKLGDEKVCREGRRDFTVTVGTIFENSKIPLSTWIASIYVITAHKKGISSLQLSRDLGITQKTALFILHRIRFIIDDPSPEPLENTVELDETYTAGKFANMNRAWRKKYQKLGIDNKTALMGIREPQMAIKRFNFYKRLMESFLDL